MNSVPSKGFQRWTETRGLLVKRSLCFRVKVKSNVFGKKRKPNVV